jgi:hypothetical protein
MLPTAAVHKLVITFLDSSLSDVNFLLSPSYRNSVSRHYVSVNIQRKV